MRSLKCLRLVLLSVALLGLLTGGVQSQPPLQEPYQLLSFDKNGTMEPGSKTDLKVLIKSRAENHPTDIFLMSHGWNNTEAKARNTYTKMVELMREQGKRIEFNKKLTPLVIGISWPSQFADDKQIEDDAALASQLLETFGVTDKVRAGLKNILASKFKRKVLEKFIDTDDLEEFIENPLPDATVEKIFRGASYYSMKKRAGLVGASGVRQGLAELQKAFPKTRFHLIGHSFGCKVWLECLREPTYPQPVETLILLQGAVSDRCFAKSLKELEDRPGAYADMAARVQGPIVITFTKNDLALGLAYPAASQIAGQFAEAPDKFRKADIGCYCALGAKGMEGIQAVPMKAVGARYQFAAGFNTINADEVIMDHNDIRNNEVAWLIWSAILRN